MRKFFKEHDLLKIVAIAFILGIILTWLVPGGSFSGAEFVEGAMTRMSIYHIFMSGVFSVNYFVLQFSFLLVLGAFYGLLSKTGGYKKIVNTIAKKIKGHETLFVLIASAVIAFLASVSTEIWHLLIIAPFIISIILKAKMSKMTAFSIAFGSMLIGILGATYSGFGLAYINEYLGTTFETQVVIKFVILVVAYVLFNFFNITHINKTLSEKKVEDVEDPFEVNDAKDVSIWPTAVILGLMLIIILIGYFDWNGIFGIDIFDKWHQSVMEYTIGEEPIFAHILGNSKQVGTFSAIGRWDLLIIQIIMVIVMIIMKFVSGLKLNDAIDGIASGMKKMLKPLFMVFIINCFFMFIYWSGIVSTIASTIMSWSKEFNVILMTLTGLVSAVFHVDFGMTGFTLGSWLNTAYPNSNEIIMLVLNGTNGIMQLIAPTSLVLMAGLSYLGIKYTEWFKYIWKFLVGIFVVLLLIYIMLIYI